MATPFTNIYDKFIRKIKDSTMLVTENEITSLDEDRLQYLLETAIEVHLIGVDSDFETKLENIDLVNKEFPDDYELTSRELTLISYAMRIPWLESFINDADYLMVATGGTRDIKETSHGNMMKQMIELQNKFEEDVNDLIIGFSFSTNSLGALS